METKNLELISAALRTIGGNFDVPTLDLIFSKDIVQYLTDRSQPRFDRANERETQHASDVRADWIDDARCQEQTA